MARIKDSIGDLITDAELKALVDKGLQEAFFAKRYETINYNQVEKPPVLVDIIKTLMESSVREAVGEWVKEHPTEIKSAVSDVIQQGVGSAVIQAFNSRLSADFHMFGQNMLNNLGRR